MSRKSLLPIISRSPASKAHPYPLQIGMRAEQMLQGASFYAAFVDVAVGLYRDSTPDAAEQIQAHFRGLGTDDHTWDQGMECMVAYMTVLPSPVFQAVVVQMVSQWDWYVRKLGDFVRFGRRHSTSPHVLSSDEEKGLRRIGIAPIRDQIKALAAVSGGRFRVSPEEMQQLEELTVVRNLGIHNQWEVDAHYIDKSANARWRVGYIRDVAPIELEAWRKVLSAVMLRSAVEIAQLYYGAPPYEPSASSRP
jgi:hypothetical protein